LRDTLKEFGTIMAASSRRSVTTRSPLSRSLPALRQQTSLWLIFRRLVEVVESSSDSEGLQCLISQLVAKRCCCT
jgi:hypothetical protein